MEPRNELKAKARELEYGESPEKALALYLQLLDRSDQPAPALWTRAGELQLRLGQMESAKQSLTRAIAAFEAMGLQNDAIAVARRLVDARIDGPDVQHRLAELSLEKSYRRFAREAVAAYARETAAEGRAGAPVDLIATFLRRFPDERDLWRDWADELVALGRAGDAVAELRKLARSLEAAGAGATAAAVEAEIGRLAAPSRSEPLPGDETTADLPILEPGADDSILPLDRDPGPLPADERQEIAPLEGLESTHAEWGDPFGTGGTEPEPLPLLGTSPETTHPAAAGDLSEMRLEGLEPTLADAVEPSEPLPLLDVPPQVDEPDPVDTDRGDPNAASAAPESTEPSPIDDEDREITEPLPMLGDESSVREAGDDGVPAPDAPSAEDDRVFAAVHDRTPPSAPAAPESTGGNGSVAGPRIHAALVELRRTTARQAPSAPDASTHYDLGVAFKEMGLVDDAIAHLAAALEQGHDPVATLEVLGEILVSRGSYETVTSLLQELGADRSPELVGIHYWLGRSAEELGHGENARRHYQTVLSIDGSFRDASERLRRIDNPF